MSQQKSEMKKKYLKYKQKYSLLNNQHGSGNIYEAHDIKDFGICIFKVDSSNFDTTNDSILINKLTGTRNMGGISDNSQAIITKDISLGDATRIINEVEREMTGKPPPPPPPPRHTKTTGIDTSESFPRLSPDLSQMTGDSGGETVYYAPELAQQLHTMATELNDVKLELSHIMYEYETMKTYLDEYRGMFETQKAMCDFLKAELTKKDSVSTVLFEIKQKLDDMSTDITEIKSSRGSTMRIMPNEFVPALKQPNMSPNNPSKVAVAEAKTVFVSRQSDSIDRPEDKSYKNLTENESKLNMSEIRKPVTISSTISSNMPGSTATPGNNDIKKNIRGLFSAAKVSSNPSNPSNPSKSN